MLKLIFIPAVNVTEYAYISTTVSPWNSSFKVPPTGSPKQYLWKPRSMLKVAVNGGGGGGEKDGRKGEKGGFSLNPLDALVCLLSNQLKTIELTDEHSTSPARILG